MSSDQTQRCYLVSFHTIWYAMQYSFKILCKVNLKLCFNFISFSNASLFYLKTWLTKSINVNVMLKKLVKISNVQWVIKSSNNTGVIMPYKNANFISLWIVQPKVTLSVTRQKDMFDDYYDTVIVTTFSLPGLMRALPESQPPEQTFNPLFRKMSIISWWLSVENSFVQLHKMTSPLNSFLLYSKLWKYFACVHFFVNKTQHDTVIWKFRDF